MKKVKKSDVAVGLLVVVNDLDDTTIYRIAEVFQFGVRLEYMTIAHGIVGGGDVDLFSMYYPTQAQLYYNLTELYNQQYYIKK